MERVFWINDFVGIILIILGIIVGILLSKKPKQCFRIDILLMVTCVFNILALIFSVFIIPSKYKIENQKYEDIIIEMKSSFPEKIKYKDGYYYFNDVIFEKISDHLKSLDNI